MSERKTRETDDSLVREPEASDDILNELKLMNRWSAALYKLLATSSLGFSDEPVERVLYVNPKGQSAWAMRKDDGYEEKPHTLTCFVDGIAWLMGKGYEDKDEKILIVRVRDDVGPLQIYSTLKNTFSKSLLAALARIPEGGLREKVRLRASIGAKESVVLCSVSYRGVLVRTQGSISALGEEDLLATVSRKHFGGDAPEQTR